MSDLIGKYDALDALCNNCDKPEPICAHYPCIQYNAIEDLPAEDEESMKNVMESIAIDMHKQTRLMQELIMTLEKMRKGQR